MTPCADPWNTARSLLLLPNSNTATTTSLAKSQRDRACLACYRLLLLRPVARGRVGARACARRGRGTRRRSQGWRAREPSGARGRVPSPSHACPMGLCPDVERPSAARRRDAGSRTHMLLGGVPAGPGNISPGDPCGWPCTPPLRFSVSFPCSRRTRGRYLTFYSSVSSCFSEHGAGQQISPNDHGLFLLSGYAIRDWLGKATRTGSHAKQS
ncbi:hypothetical protein SETIT_7G085700v2 [Setaria italica]|uniref:Uncharacterized protein n=2 Tax=Setaria TaxID=4554 RepID=A0A368RTP6_SETIT|nr:hypothetical protein SETIT_7G085700v2 [Setaria italica]TKW04189.1 hypothetical protein SEVIR_7G092900v2 [Setaria viridis]